MRHTLTEYASVGRDLAAAVLANNTTQAYLLRSWAYGAVSAEHEPDQILARYAFDRAYLATMQQGRVVAAKRRA